MIAAMPDHGDTASPKGGRIFFSGASRSLVEEDVICLTSVGVDIGSSTAHLLFSRITLERLDTRYVVSDREVLYQSDILLTPYLDSGDIDTNALRVFFDTEYSKSGLSPDQVDTGALILTGVAVRRRNARAIGALFADEAGKFVAVSAGDSLEALMSAHGSGAVAASKDGRLILNVDIGGGTTKIALCQAGEILHATAVEAGARLIVTDKENRVIRLEEFGEKTAQSLGMSIAIGKVFDDQDKDSVAARLSLRIIAAINGELDEDWLRLPGLPQGYTPDALIFSGGVSEYIYGNVTTDFGDLGPRLALHLKSALETTKTTILPHSDGIRATVLGASQYSVQLSGSTVFFDPAETLPLTNIATICPKLSLDAAVLDVESITREVQLALRQQELDSGESPVAIAIKWAGSATYHRLDALANGVIAGLGTVLLAGHPLIMVVEGDIGGLLGIHCRENELLPNPIISIDGISLGALDFIDIGEVILSTGAVPVVVKSLVFPAEAAAVTGQSHDKS
ncbi:MAG: ethanolamine ammonia-lyase reactivating factor EutA [Rhodobacteraceae bacterium]|nr:ethanolamine ammonia-lyase reactivating factor EutA [Paracoccaceae bacterium]